MKNFVLFSTMVLFLLFVGALDQNASAQSLSITNAYVTDSSGNMLTDPSLNILNKASCGQQAIISVNVNNSDSTDKQFKLYYIVYDSAGKIVYVHQQVSTAVAGHTAGPSINWTPTGGLYKVMILLYSNPEYNLNAVVGNDIDTVNTGSQDAEISTIIEAVCKTTQNVKETEDSSNKRLAIGEEGVKQEKFHDASTPQWARSGENAIKPKVPEWIKQNSEWYSQGLISEDDYIKGLEWMINNGVIRIGKATPFLSEKIDREYTSGKSYTTDQDMHEQRTNCPGWWVFRYCFVKLPFEECKLELMDVVDDAEFICPKIMPSINAIEEQYYKKIGEATRVMLEELNKYELESTSHTIKCPFLPDCGTTGPTFPDTPDDIFKKFQQTIKQLDKERRELYQWWGGSALDDVRNNMMIPPANTVMLHSGNVAQQLGKSCQVVAFVAFGNSLGSAPMQNYLVNFVVVSGPGPAPQPGTSDQNGEVIRSVSPGTTIKANVQSGPSLLTSNTFTCPISPLSQTQ